MILIIMIVMIMIMEISFWQVLLDTTQLYYYFFHKTPHMMLRRVLMVLAASLEFERGHNSEVHIISEHTKNALGMPVARRNIHKFAEFNYYVCLI